MSILTVHRSGHRVAYSPYSKHAFGWRIGLLEWRAPERKRCYHLYHRVRRRWNYGASAAGTARGCFSSNCGTHPRYILYLVWTSKEPLSRVYEGNALHRIEVTARSLFHAAVHDMVLYGSTWMSFVKPKYVTLSTLYASRWCGDQPRRKVKTKPTYTAVHGGVREDALSIENRLFWISD